MHSQLYCIGNDKQQNNGKHNKYPKAKHIQHSANRQQHIDNRLRIADVGYFIHSSNRRGDIFKQCDIVYLYAQLISKRVVLTLVAVKILTVFTQTVTVLRKSLLFCYILDRAYAVYRLDFSAQLLS